MESHSVHVHGDFAAGMRSRSSARVTRGTFASGIPATAPSSGVSIAPDAVTDCRGIEMTAGLTVVVASRDGSLHERVIKHLRTVTSRHPSRAERRHEVVFETGDHATADRCAVVVAAPAGYARARSSGSRTCSVVRRLALSGRRRPSTGIATRAIPAQPSRSRQNVRGGHDKPHRWEPSRAVTRARRLAVSPPGRDKDGSKIDAGDEARPKLP
jgi:hypothetical protein